MRIEMNRDRVYGFLDTKGTKIVNGRGEEIILTGWGLGNWLLPEGYMWLAGGARMDRPRTIERIVREVAGKEYAKKYWKQFRRNFIRECDIAAMAEAGYNSVRIPINAPLFLEEGPGLNWVDEGWELLDKCIDWCEKYGLYAFIDLHGAPGGQTGANIDDSIDNIPRLFLDQDCFDKGVALWKRIAERYKDRWIVGGYDLLNEPIRPENGPDTPSMEHLVPRLMEFYREATRAIREVDAVHTLSIEGHHWATDPTIFAEKYDDKQIIHFHRYACLPDITAYESWIALSEKLQSPLWLGETGENIAEWFTAMYPLAAELGIGYNVWPWKKMNTVNSPCSVNAPEGWELITSYAKGGPHPGYERAQAILDQHLENMLLENCVRTENLDAHVFRTPGCVVRGTDFDELGGNGGSYQCLRDVDNTFGYREGTGMEIVEHFPDRERAFAFDTRWERFTLGLEAGEFACYTFNDVAQGNEAAQAEVHVFCEKPAVIAVYQDEEKLGSYSIGGLDEKMIVSGLRLRTADKTVLKVAVEQGRVEIDRIVTFKPRPLTVN